jgi:two-component system chemotaxis response regulator CheY
MAAPDNSRGNVAVRTLCRFPPFEDIRILIFSSSAMLVAGGDKFAASPRLGTALVDPTIPTLIVDDSTNALILQSILRQAGFTNVDHVQDGHAALERLRAGNISLVIARWKMSPMSGLQLLHRVRQDAAMDCVRFILISGSRHPQLTDTVRRLGANGCLLKPFTVRDLQQTIEQAFV